jgi:predicted membrane protein
MKLSDFTKALSSLEIATLVIFVIYIIFPFKTPAFLSGTVNTPLGLIVLLVVTLYLFFYTNPILGVVYIFVAYELIRRTSLVRRGSADNYMVRSSPSEVQRAIEMNQMNPERVVTLEETVISKMAPAQVFNDNTIDTGFKPVTERVVGASKFL